MDTYIIYNIAFVLFIPWYRQENSFIDIAPYADWYILQMIFKGNLLFFSSPFFMILNGTQTIIAIMIIIIIKK